MLHKYTIHGIDDFTTVPKKNLGQLRESIDSVKALPSKHRRLLHDLLDKVAEFQRWDDDGNGVLDFDEIKSAISDCFSPAMQKMLFANGKFEQTFKDIDANGDGQLSFGEFYDQCGRDRLFYGLIKNQQNKAKGNKQADPIVDLDSTLTPRQRQLVGASDSTVQPAAAKNRSSVKLASLGQTKTDPGDIGMGGRSEDRLTRGVLESVDEEPPPPRRAHRKLSETKGSRAARTDPGTGGLHPTPVPPEGGRGGKKLQRGKSALSLEEKLAAYEASQDKLDSMKLNEAEKEIRGSGQDNRTIKGGADMATIAKLELKNGVTKVEKEAALRAIKRVPGTRKVEHTRELVKWMQSCDLLHGLSVKRIQALSLSAKETTYPEGRAVIKVGDLDSSLHIVFRGQTAVYTQRDARGGAVFDADRARMATGASARATSVGAGTGGARRQSVVVDGGRTNAAAARKASVSTEGQKAKMAEAGRRASIAIRQGEPESDNPAQAAGMPVRVDFNEGDSFGVQQVHTLPPSGDTYHAVYTTHLTGRGWCVIRRSTMPRTAPTTRRRVARWMRMTWWPKRHTR